MPAPTPIDIAHRRYRILRSMIEHHREMAKSPAYQRNLVKLGFLDEGEKPKDATKIIEQTFDELSGLVAHLAVVDMTAALELGARPKIGTTAGVVRKSYKEHKNKSKDAVYAKRLILDQDFFKTMKSLSDLLEPFVDEELINAFNSAREARNNFAHGTNITVMPAIDVDEALVALNEIYDIL